MVMCRAVLVGVAFVSLVAGGRADNLFPEGDFSQAKEGLSPLVFTNGGCVSLFTEQYSWNRCGRLHSPMATTNGQTVTTMAGAVIGSDGKTPGIPVRGGAIYDFSVEVRGNTRNVGFGACVWKTGLWKDGKFIQTTLRLRRSRRRTGRPTGVRSPCPPA